MPNPIASARRSSRPLFPALLILIVVALAAWFYATPYLVLRQMRQAIDARDAQTLSAHVDFPALRDSIKQQLSGEITKHLGGQGNPLAALGAMIGSAVAGPVIDAYATPAGVAAILSGLPPSGNPMQRPPALPAPEGTASGDSAAAQNAQNGSANEGDDNAPLAKDSVSSGYRGFNQFQVTYPRDDSGSTYTAIFERSGLFDWKLAAIDLNQ